MRRISFPVEGMLTSPWQFFVIPWWYSSPFLHLFHNLKKESQFLFMWLSINPDICHFGTHFGTTQRKSILGGTLRFGRPPWCFGCRYSFFELAYFWCFMWQIFVIDMAYLVFLNFGSHPCHLQDQLCIANRGFQ